MIGAVANPERRAACLADPVLFLKTYGIDDQGNPIFYNDFAEHHLAMIQAIHKRAINGGDKAIAAPRGDGKSTVAIWMTIFVILAGLIRSIVVIAATRKHAQKLFKKIKRAFMRNELLMADFPEIGDCVRALDGAPQRAAKQHIAGQPTNITWTQDEIVFPDVVGSPYGGVHVAYYGLDSAIRGGRFEFALIDDPETREVASGEQHWRVEEMIDKDVAGLAGPNTAISRVVLTTIQNPYCYSARVTDRTIKPTFSGDRYGMLSKWPENTEMWDEYVSIRQKCQAEGDKDGLEALQFYIDNREEMEKGAVVTNPDRFNRRLNSDGEPVEISALQSFFNRVADWGMDAVMSELQNDPQDKTAVETERLTAGVVQTRVSGFERGKLPVDSATVTMGLDLGDRYGHWVKIAWFGNAVGVVIDYGILEVPGMVGKAKVSRKARELALYNALLGMRTPILAENAPEFCLIDAGDGDHTETVYSFVRDAGGSPWAASKGWDAGRFRMPADSNDKRRVFNECYAALRPQDRIWLYNVNTEFWKHWLQQRFLTPTFDDQHQFNDGSLSLFSSDNKKEHLSFAHHMVSEMRQERFIEGKGIVRKWMELSRNNHFLDAAALACAAAGCVGVRLLPKAEPIRTTIEHKPRPRLPRLKTPSGRPFLLTER